MRLARRVAVLTITVLAAAATALPGVADAVTSIDLLTSADVQIDGAAASDFSGGAVGGDTDFNHDGKRDLLVGAGAADPAGRVDAGSAYLVFGNPASLLDLAGLGSAGVRFDGAAAGDGAGLAVSHAGDVNADGVDDVIIGAWGADPPGRAGAGIAYVLFGSASPPAAIDLSLVGTPGGPPGFRILGAAASDFAGFDVSDAGNVNGDENDDVIVGAPARDPLGRGAAGSAYVVFGKSNNSDVDLNALGTGGYEIHGAAAGDGAGTSVANAEDVTLDGRPDQLVGAPQADGTGKVDAGAAFVSAGKNNTTAVDLNALGSAGYRLNGASAGDGAGNSVDSAGDVNGDGRPDQLWGAPDAGVGLEGAAYVTYGHAPVAPGGPVVAVPKQVTYTILGASPGDLTGWAVAGLGNADGAIRPDQVVGAPGSANGGRAGAGAAYMVSGVGTAVVLPPTVVDLATYTGGYRIDGAAVDSGAGISVAGPGNVGGTGTRDVFLGASNATANGRNLSGSSYVVFGAGLQAVLIPGGIAINPFIPFHFPKPAPHASSAAAAGRAIRYTLRRPAKVTMRLLRILRGRRVGLRRLEPGKVTGTVRCVPGKPGGRRSRERACTRYVELGRLVRRHRTAGAKRVPFDGRVGGKALPKGRYRLEAIAQDRVGHVHGPFRAKFRIG